ncbi:MAG: CotH kinase family protein [Deltaproteobacteria bacterium]|nr:CotH kinase family protein [Deltaproteobacteria bacterium]
MPTVPRRALQHPRLVAALAALVAAMSVACPVDPNATADGGVHTPRDAGVDTPRDAGSDADAGPPAQPCVPRATGASSVTEGETIDVEVACATGRADVSLVLGALPDGATAAPHPGGVHLVWPTDLDDAQALDVEVTVPDLGETGTVHLAVADASLEVDNVPPVDPLRYPEEHGLPVIFLSHEPAAEEYEAVTVIAGGHQYSGTEAKLRGASSLGYPKRSFTVRLDKDDRYQLPARGFVERKKIVLISTFDDNSYVRQRLAYQLYDRTDGGAPHTTLAATSAVLYVGGSYFGLYTLADHVDRDLFEETLGQGDGGNLYKSVNHNANFRRERFPRGSGDKSFLGDGWELRDEPDLPVGQWDDLVALVAFTTDADEATFDAQIGSRVSVSDLAAWWVFATSVVGADSYGKNAYLYKEHASAPFRYAPWDFNHSFGQAWETSRTDPATPVDTGWPIDTNQLWERLLASPEHGPMLRAVAEEALAGPLSLTNVLVLFDAMVADVEPSARKDQAVWGADYAAYYPRGDLQDFDGEVAYTRAWIEERWAFLTEP